MGFSPLLAHISTSLGEVQTKREKIRRYSFEERRKWNSTRSRGWLCL
jgi:hypothetical protein